MSIKFKQLTGLAKTEIKILEPNENGEIEELIHSPTHLRITSDVLNELDRIVVKIKAENEKILNESQKTQEKSKNEVFKQRNAIAEQLAYLVKNSDIIGEDGNTITPSVDFYKTLSINYLNTTFWAIMESVLPKKKITNPSDSSTSKVAG